MALRSAVLGFYRGAVRTIVPQLQHSQARYERVLDGLVTRETRWLDVGCGHQVLPDWRLATERELVGRCRRVVGLDRDFPSLLRHATVRDRVYGDVGALPFADDSFTLVTANMVVEHLQHPELEFSEIRRVLAPGGLFVFHTPNLNGYIARAASAVPEAVKGPLIRLLEGRAAHDVFPTHYRANTQRAIGALADRLGFGVERLHMTATTAQFSVIPPLAVLELLWIRALLRPGLRDLRTNIIAVLRKPERPVAAGHASAGASAGQAGGPRREAGVGARPLLG